MINTLPTERLSVGGVIDPDNHAAGTVTTGWVAMDDLHSALAILIVGDISANGTVDAKLQQASDSSGTGAKDIADTSITQLTASNKQSMVNLRSESLDRDGEFNHVRLSVTIGTASAELAAVLLGFDPRYAPPDNADSVSDVV